MNNFFISNFLFKGRLNSFLFLKTENLFPFFYLSSADVHTFLKFLIVIVIYLLKPNTNETLGNLAFN